MGSYQSLIEEKGEFSKFVKTYSNETNNRHNNNVDGTTATVSHNETNATITKYKFENEPSKKLIKKEDLKTGVVR